MPETQPTAPDVAGVTRTPTGEISSPPTSTPATETIVRPPATPETKPPTTTPSTETKAPADGKETREPRKSVLNEESKEEGAPTTYSDFTVPEGFTLDKDVAGEASTLFKEANLTQTQAQKLVDFYVKLTKESHDAPFQAWEDTQEKWRGELNSDPDIGGSRLNGTKASIGRLLDSLGDTALVDGFREAMDYTGAGNNPFVVKFLARIAQRLTEGGPVRGSGPSPDGMRRSGEGAPSAAQAIYPNLPSNQR